MIKLSEVLKYYEEKGKTSDADIFFGEEQIFKKISTIKMLMDVLGDVQFSEEKLQYFLYGVSQMKIGKFGIQEKDAYQEIKAIYDLISDSEMQPSIIISLFDCYKVGVFTYYIEDIKACLSQSSEEFIKALKMIIIKAETITTDDAAKLDPLKEVYDESFITKIQEIVKRRMIPYEKVISILPSKELIDSSTVEVPLGYSVVSGQDIVLRRLSGYILDEEIEQTPSDKCIKLGICSTGDYVYTPFTKKEYEDSLTKEITLQRRK